MSKLKTLENVLTAWGELTTYSALPYSKCLGSVLACIMCSYAVWTWTFAWTKARDISKHNIFNVSEENGCFLLTNLHAVVSCQTLSTFTHIFWFSQTAYRSTNMALCCAKQFANDNRTVGTYSTKHMRHIIDYKKSIDVPNHGTVQQLRKIKLKPTCQNHQKL